MTQDAGPEGGSAAGAVSIGEEDQLREIEMEHEQRQQDDGVPPPRLGEKRATRKGVARAPSAPEDEHGQWEGRVDEPDHPGQTKEGGLGGSGPAQP